MPWRYRSFLIMALLLGAIERVLGAGDPDVLREPVPSWVEPHVADIEAMPSTPFLAASSQILLLDYQENTLEHQDYRHLAFRVLNQESINELSDIILEYNPSFETLTLHFIRIHRDGRTIDKLRGNEIRTFQREESLEQGFYAGTVTAVINLRDVRAGDVLEYAHTRSGANPLLSGHVMLTIKQQIDSPIHEFRQRVIVDPAKPLYVRLHQGAEKPSRISSPLGAEYRWVGRDIPALPVDTNVPAWFDPNPRFSLSSFPDWQAVSEWAQPLYALDDADLAAAGFMADSISHGGDLRDRVLRAIRFVQDDVRYLSRSEGLWAYQPHKPQATLEHRFGDCKDKSLLLVALLRQLGVTAHPILVSSTDREHIADDTPSPLAFDHCVVGFEMPAGVVYVDPTLTHQGGGLDNQYFPNFGQGLPITNEPRDLVALPAPPPRKYDVDEQYVVDAIGRDGAGFEVITRYYFQMADWQREYLALNSLEDISRSYLRYYSRIWPGIESTAPLEVLDEDREGSNMLEIHESYYIHDAWVPAYADTTRRQLEILALEMHDFADPAPSPARSMPYDAGPLVDVHHRSRVVMPEDWNIDIEPVRLAGFGMSFDNAFNNSGPIINCDYHYMRTVRDIPAEEAASFIAVHNQMLQEIGLIIFDRRSGEFAPSTLALLLTLTALLGSGALALLVWRRYDPEPSPGVSVPRRIGGWLCLPAIGITLRPLIIAGSILTDDTYMNQNTWELAERGLVESSVLVWRALLMGELVGNICSLAFSILVLFLFYGRRSSMPIVFAIYMIGSATFLTFDVIASRLTLGSAVTPNSTIEVVRIWIATLIWVPYFLNSQRVRETFVNRFARPSTVSAEVLHPTS
jgi:hypothetical protein